MILLGKRGSGGMTFNGEKKEKESVKGRKIWTTCLAFKSNKSTAQINVLEQSN